MSSNQDTIRIRTLRFSGPMPPHEQAEHAHEFLDGLQGVYRIERVADDGLQLTYDLNHTCLEFIETHLQAQGFHLDNSLLTKLRRALHYYSEAALIDTLRNGDECRQRIQEVAKKTFEQTRHGCTDPRPEPWRHYL